jgi:hypothetical protein
MRVYYWLSRNKIALKLREFNGGKFCKIGFNERTKTEEVRAEGVILPFYGGILVRFWNFFGIVIKTGITMQNSM